MLQFVDTPLGEGTLALPAQRAHSWNADLAEAIIPGSPSDRLAEPRALVVTTGQQPGLFTGPLYTFHKALSARALALALETAWGRPVVPVFWVAGDDHDYSEASVSYWTGPDGALVEAALPPRPPEAPLRPMYQELLPADVAVLLDQLESGLPPSPARDGTLSWLRRHYAPGRSFAGAFGSSLAQALGALGVVCLDASHPAVKRAAMPWILDALRRAPDLDRLLAARARVLTVEGRDPGVKVGEGASLVFLEGPGGRDRLLVEADGVIGRRSDQRLSWSGLDRVALDDPQRFSPNVLLRPVIESALLPTVAYIAGPAELRYLQLADALYEPLGVTPQLPVPRWSGVVIEPRVARIVEKFGATVDDLFDGARDLEARVVRGLAPPDFDAAFSDVRAALHAGLARIAAVATKIDPTLEKPVQSVLGGALSSLADLEKRLLQAQKRRQGELIAQLDRARTAVFPNGKPQERVLGLPGYAGRYGIEVIDELAQHVHAWYRRALEGAAATA